MATLTDAEIKDACHEVVATSLLYQRLQWIAFLTMYQTGCREGEVVQLWRWSLHPFGYYELTTQKGGAIRTIQAADLPLEFRTWLASRPTGIAPTSTDRLRSAFRQMVPYGDLSSGNKGISTHLFRYNFMRSLKAEGKTLPEIKAIMALTSTKVVTGYLNNPVRYDG